MNRPPLNRRNFRPRSYRKQKNFSIHCGPQREAFQALIQAIAAEPHRVHVVDLGPLNPDGQPMRIPPFAHTAFIELLESMIQDLP